MNDRDKLLNNAKNDDERIFISRIIDIAIYTKDKSYIKSTQFLNGHELMLANQVVSKLGVCFCMFGGYDEAERKVIVCYPDYMQPDDIDYPISVISVKGREIGNLSHRDYLGSFLGLGIKREKIGDIIINENIGYIFCMSDISEYIISQLEKIGNKRVKLEICNFSDIKLPPKKFKDIFTTVSSLRLDSIISSGLGISRSDAAGLIKQEKASINWETISDSGKHIDVGQIISIKGFGRIEIFEIKGETKKGRIGITIRRYI